MKMNKACDLSSISVLPPPQSRRSNVASNGAESSIFGRSQVASQLRSQQKHQSQQSFSQGVSSQPNVFSQLTQNSPDDIVMIDQRFGSQERDNSTRRPSSLPPVNNTREESQNYIKRSSTNFMRKWNAPEQRTGQISEELEYRIGMMETSLSRCGMILDSIQSDIMQVNKGRKELALEMESIRQKLNVSDNTMQIMNKGQEDVKVNLDRAVNLICDQLSQHANQESSHDIFSLLTALPEKIELCMQKLKNDLCKSFTKEMQAMACSQQIFNQKLTSAVHQSRVINRHVTQQDRPSNISVQASQLKVVKETAAVKTETGTWRSVKHKQTTFANRDSETVQKQRGIAATELERVPRINIESDEEISRDFCYLLEDKETGTSNFSMQEAREETERILRKARRRKRKHNKTIIIN